MHAQRADGSRRASFVTTYSRREVGDRPVTAVLVVVPLKVTDDAQAVADRIVLTAAPAGETAAVARAVVPAEGGQCVIDMAANGTSITRP